MRVSERKTVTRLSIFSLWPHRLSAGTGSDVKSLHWGHRKRQSAQGWVRPSAMLSLPCLLPWCHRKGSEIYPRGSPSTELSCHRAGDGFIYRNTEAPCLYTDSRVSSLYSNAQWRPPQTLGPIYTPNTPPCLIPHTVHMATAISGALT